ncbi:hypothetical protein AB0C70_38215 [Streptomyces sp. NPDC048564]|uniref:hypothetical protein n=1 Tax=Streptomyces sp. NPDC048564 TaxID=3155760 RepID=UPI00341FD24F
MDLRWDAHVRPSLVRCVTGERGDSQARRAFALAFTDPVVADDELALAEQLLAGVDLRATTLITHIAALARDAGRTGAADLAQVLRSEIRTAGVTYAELALPSTTPSATTRTRWPRRSPGCARTPAAATSPTTATSPPFMADMAPAHPSGTQWADSEPATRQ